jgi:type I restriction enzyme, S subunit
MSDSWVACTIRDLLIKGEAEIKTGPFGTQLHASDYVETGTPVINARNIGFGNMRIDKLEFIAEETVQRLSSHLLEPGDIVFGRKGTVERHVFIRAEQAHWFQGTDCLRLRLKSPSVEPQFISYCLLTEYHKKWIVNQSSHGATMTSLNQGIISRIPLRLPPLSAQRKIAAILSAYDNLIENNLRRIKILEEMAQNLYREWFVKFRFPGYESARFVDSPLGRLPEAWEVASIADVAIIHRGRSYKGRELADIGGRPFINLKCIKRDGGFRSSGLKKYTGLFKDTQTVRSGEMVMAITDMTQERRIVARVGRVSLLDADFGIVSMDLVRIASRGNLPEIFLYAMFRWSGFADEVKQHANGANVLHLLPDRIEEYRFIRPISEIATRFEDIVLPIINLSDSLEHQNNKLSLTRDLLLPKLIACEVDISELDITVPEEG